MDVDGSNQRRVIPEFGQFVTWSPDGEHLLVSGRSLYVIRPDGTPRSLAGERRHARLGRGDKADDAVILCDASRRPAHLRSAP